MVGGLGLMATRAHPRSGSWAVQGGSHLVPHWTCREAVMVGRSLKKRLRVGMVETNLGGIGGDSIDGTRPQQRLVGDPTQDVECEVGYSRQPHNGNNCLASSPMITAAADGSPNGSPSGCDAESWPWA